MKSLIGVIFPSFNLRRTIISCFNPRIGSPKNGDMAYNTILNKHVTLKSKISLIDGDDVYWIAETDEGYIIVNEAHLVKVGYYG